jgi:DNA-binding NarL/FixJ family response regulator
MRVLLARDGRGSAVDLRRLISDDPDLVAVGESVAAYETLHQAQDLQPDVVVLDRTLSRDTVLLARELTSLDRPPAVVVRSACAEQVMTIAAIVAGVRGIVGRDDPDSAVCDAIQWVARNRRWLPDIPLSALSRAGSRLERDDLPILMMLLRGTPSSDSAADVGIGAASMDVRRSAILRDMLGEPAPGWSRFVWHAGESAPTASDADPRIAIAA